MESIIFPKIRGSLKGVYRGYIGYIGFRVYEFPKIWDAI